jgi:hypothetical protein
LSAPASTRRSSFLYHDMGTLKVWDCMSSAILAFHAATSAILQASQVHKYWQLMTDKNKGTVSSSAQQELAGVTSCTKSPLRRDSFNNHTSWKWPEHL